MEYWLEELGYFNEDVCKALQEEFNGATYFDNGNIHHIYNAENQPDDSVNAETDE